jgi:hypothetical protein
MKWKNLQDKCNDTIYTFWIYIIWWYILVGRSEWLLKDIRAKLYFGTLYCSVMCNISSDPSEVPFSKWNNATCQWQIRKLYVPLWCSILICLILRNSCWITYHSMPSGLSSLPNHWMFVVHIAAGHHNRLWCTSDPQLLKVPTLSRFCSMDHVNWLTRFVRGEHLCL